MKILSRKTSTKRAFTLIELLVVILILAVLAAMIVPRLISRTGDANIAKARTDLSTLGKLIETYRLDTGYYPTTEEGLEALRSSDAPGWKGPYTQKPISIDPWGNEYIYEWPGPDGDESYYLYSLGKDNQEGGEGENQDIIESGE